MYSRIFAVLWSAGLFLLPVTGRSDDSAAKFSESVRPILVARCLTCHATDKQEGELDLERFDTVARIKSEPAVWEDVLEKLHTGEMPPEDAPALTAQQKKELVEWVARVLDEVALEHAGDPGPVALRRLSNVEYTYSVRDLTGVDQLDPAHEFPVDGAAGEGFTNASAALVMSPALLAKYLDAAKEVSRHAVLTPGGIRFSESTSARDWTDETLADIREFYGRFSGGGNATPVNLQGIKFDTNAGGRLPVEKYLAALQGHASADGLSKKYLAILREALTDNEPSRLLDPLRVKFRSGKLSAADVEAWQRSLWRFASVGHIGKVNGPKAWQEPVVPLAAQHEMRVKLTAPSGGDVTLYLTANNAGDGDEGDVAVWENARFVAPGRADLALRDVRAVVRRVALQRARITATVPQCLAAAQEAQSATASPNIPELAQKYQVDAGVLTAWLDYLGISSGGEVRFEPLIPNRMERTPDYNFIQGWTGEQALSVLANSSDATVRIPGIMQGHSIATHPSPQRAAVIAWRSPVTGLLRVTGKVNHAHPECGNGVTWSLELHGGRSRQVLASGATRGGTLIDMGTFEGIRIRQGEAIELVIGPREGNHSCDLTAINMTLQVGDLVWDLADDVSPDILAGNPHADRQGNAAVWHFFSRPATAEFGEAIPAGSSLAMWSRAQDAGERQRLAGEVQRLLQQGVESLPADAPDRALFQQLTSVHGPLLAAALRLDSPEETDLELSDYGLDPLSFGKDPAGNPADGKSLCVRAPQLVKFKVPGSLVDGTEFVVTGRLLSAHSGSVQMQVSTERPENWESLNAGLAESSMASGQWSDNNLRTQFRSPVIVNDGSVERRRWEEEFAEFRRLFPIALCYTKIVPVDEVVTLTLYYREDDHLKRLMLDEDQSAELDRLWNQLRFVSDAPWKQVDAFEQLYQFATQDADPSAFEPMREPIRRDAELFRQEKLAAEPVHVQAVLDFAAKAWRRPLSGRETAELQSLYQTLRGQGLPHPEAVRMLLARVLVAPAFLYRGERPAAGNRWAAVNDWELATRLSYFLWSSVPDQELCQLAATGQLHEPAVLAAQTKRMIQDPRIRRLANEFGCQWLHVRDVATLDEKSDRHFPTFASLRGDMQEEVVRFFTDLLQQDRSVLLLLDSDYSFVNGPLAEHYGLKSHSGAGWQRVDGLREQGRGGILGFAATLAKQSGASRTSPILRGTWLSEVVLGDKLPNPPQGVPVLPDEAPPGLTERQLTERHSQDVRCAGCHRRIDPFGFALEGFDAIGRRRTQDAAGLAINTKAELPDGTHVDGLAGLREYLLAKRRDDFLRQFCRKLLGFALGRGVRLSDKPLLDAMLKQLEQDEYRIGSAVDQIVRSEQFLSVRGREYE